MTQQTTELFRLADYRPKRKTVYFSRLELIFGGEATKLFLSVDMPIRLQSAVQWMSVKGVQSWFIPAAVLAGGIVLLNYSNTMTLISNFLRKFRLW